jgi:hypothetical protein
VQLDFPSVTAAQPDLTDAAINGSGNHVEALLKRSVHVR